MCTCAQVCGQCTVTVCGHRMVLHVVPQVPPSLFLVICATPELHSQLCFCLFCFWDSVFYWLAICQVGYTNWLANWRDTWLYLLSAEITSMHLHAWPFFFFLFFYPHAFWESNVYLGACKAGNLPSYLQSLVIRFLKSYTFFSMSELFYN